VYHLHSKPLYRVLAQVDNRNRRVVSPALIARKLMVLDYVLTTPCSEWLATEADKVAWFTNHEGIARVDLPQRRYYARSTRTPLTTRYFVQKLPVRIVPGASVEFVHLVEDETGRHFRQFLDDHTRLLSRLPAWTITLVCPHHLPLGPTKCEHAFKETFGRSASMSAVAPADLAWFFRTRTAVDRGDFDVLTAKDLDRFRDLRERLSTAPIERLYVQWQQAGDAVLATPLSAEPEMDIRTRLRTHVLPWRYEQFGSTPGLV
jgi:hypothetical protein